MKRIVALLPALLAACVPAGRPPAPSPSPTPVAAVPAPPPAPPHGPDWRDWPLTPGIWRYLRTGGESTATFGAGPDGALFRLTCSPATRQVTLSTPAAPGTSPLTVRTSSTARTVPADAPLAATDPLLDAMAFSRGRFVVERAGRPPLVVPAYAEVGRVTEDCRP